MIPHARVSFIPIQRKFSRWDANSLVNAGLFILLSSSYIVVIYVAVIAAGTLPFGAQLMTIQNIWFRVPRWLDLIALALIVITWLPVSRWLRVHIHDLIYAKHDNPYILISQVNQQLQAMTSAQVTLPVLVETIAGVLKLPFVAVETTHAGQPLRYAFGISRIRAEIRQLPIAYLDKPIGVLLVSARAANLPLSENDLGLLGDVAQHLGIALRAAQLTTELQSSRERLVMAREEERRRIRNDLHDGLAPTLSSVQMQLGAVRNLIHQNPTHAEELVDDLRDDLRQATAEIRQLVYNLRPPMLDELGLVEAIQNFRVLGSEIRFDVEAPDPMPPLPAAVEVAVYRIASEAVHNVLKHSQATVCAVRIEVHEGRLLLKVTDNGRGFPAEFNMGVGLRSMKERAVEVGGTFFVQPGSDGGLCITANLPIHDD